ncbi:MAG: SAM-dependent methyltransferase [Burkholderiales bacterium]
MRCVLHKSLLVLGMTLLPLLTAHGQSAVPPEYEREGGPYVPTPNVVVDRMLDFAKVGAHDHVIDLGSGDGVIVITAGYKRKSSGYGVDIDEELVRLSNQRAKNLGMDGRVSFETKDIFMADVRKATVVTLYLLPEFMQRLRHKLYTELQPGTRIVSHDYHFEQWMHDDEVRFDVPEKEMISGDPSATLYLWVVPAKVGGAWRMLVDGGGEYDVALQQSYQRLMGSAENRDGKAGLLEPKINGSELVFQMQVGAEHRRFTGRVDGDRIQGTADFGNGRIVRWSAVRGSKS